MMTTVELSEKRIADEVRSIRRAGRKVLASRRSALAFLKRIGADGWPNSPTKANGTKASRRVKK